MSRWTTEDINKLRVLVLECTKLERDLFVTKQQEDAYTDYDRSVVKVLMRAEFPDGKQPEVVKIFSAAFGKNLEALVARSVGQGVKLGVLVFVPIEHSDVYNWHGFAFPVTDSRMYYFNNSHQPIAEARDPYFNLGGNVPRHDSQTTFSVATDAQVNEFFDSLVVVAVRNKALGGLNTEHDVKAVLDTIKR